MGDQHADRTPRNSRGSAAKALVIAGVCLIAGLSFVGLSIFSTSLWIAYAVMAMTEIVVAVVLFVSRWTSRPAAVVLALLAVFQVGQSYSYEQVRYSSDDPVIPIDNLGVLVLCALAIYLIKAGRLARDRPAASPLGRAFRLRCISKPKQDRNCGHSS